MALVTFSDCYQSMWFQNLNVLTKIAVLSLDFRYEKSAI
jgi:hypothetical protein